MSTVIRTIQNNIELPFSLTHSQITLLPGIPVDLYSIISNDEVLQLQEELQGLADRGSITVLFTENISTVLASAGLDIDTPGITYPILAPNGSNGAPTYSFTIKPTIGLWYDVENDALVINNSQSGGGINVPGSTFINFGAANFSNGVNLEYDGTDLLITPNSTEGVHLQSGVLKVPNGHSNAPSYAFASAPSHGFWYDSNFSIIVSQGSFGIPTGGILLMGPTDGSGSYLHYDSIDLSITNNTGAFQTFAQFQASSGAVSAPGISFINDSSSGLSFNPVDSNFDNFPTVTLSASGVAMLVADPIEQRLYTPYMFESGNGGIALLVTPSTGLGSPTISDNSSAGIGWGTGNNGFNVGDVFFVNGGNAAVGMAVLNGNNAMYQPTTFSNPLLAASGSSSAPSYSFASEPNTGIYDGIMNMTFMVNGQPICVMNAFSVQATPGSAATPGYTFNAGNGDDGMYLVDNSTLGFSTDTVARFYLSSAGLAMQNGTPIFAADGSIGSPSISFGSTPSFGFFLDYPAVSTANDFTIPNGQVINFGPSTSEEWSILHDTVLNRLNFVWAGGTNVLSLADNASGVQLIDGSLTNPSYSFSSDPTVGFYMDATDGQTVALSANSQLLIDPAGVGVSLLFGPVGAPAVSMFSDGSNFNINLNNGGSSLSINLATAAINEPTGSVSAPSYSFRSDTGTGMYRILSHGMGFASNGVQVAQFDDDSTAGDTRFMLWDVDKGTLSRVSVGAADSGGTGFKVLRIPN